MSNLLKKTSFKNPINNTEIENIPVLIGVTGHRDLHALAINDVKKILDNFFYRIKQDFPNTRFIVVSGLAEGADQIVASTALSAGLELWAMLPTSINEYEKDFLDSENLDQFHKLLSSSSEIFNASILNDFDENFSLRPKIYENLRDQLCRMSHILIAVWNGIDGGPIGGTSDVVNAFVNGLYPSSSTSHISLPSCGDVYQIYVPRLNDHPWEASSNWIYSNPLHSEISRKKQNSHIDFGRIKDTLKFINDYTIETNVSTNLNSSFPSYLLPYGFSKLNESTIKILGRWFSSADEISSAYAIKRQYSLMFVVINSLIFSLLMLSYGSLIDNVWPFIIGFILLGSAYFFIISKWYQKIDSYFIFSRGFAEMLRVAIIWRACGVHQNLSPVVSSAGLSINDNLSIAAKSIDAITAINSNHNVNEDSALVLKHWVTSQINYFSGSANKISYHENRQKLYKKISISCIFGAGAFYFATFFADIFIDRNELTNFTIWSMFAFWTSLSLGTLAVAYSQVMGHDDHATDYREALIKFQIVNQNLSGNNISQELALELGMASLQEALHWVMTKRRHPVKLPF